jgi:sugar lactone lactonase YvrE
VSFTLDGRPLLVLGTRGVHSDTGAVKNWLVERPAGPFNHPTEMIPHPNGDIYVTDGYRNSRVHRFTRDGRLVKSWGTPGKAEGQFHLPHSIAIDAEGRLYIADRANKRIQIFTPEGEYLGKWTEMGGPNDIARAKDGTSYIAEQEDEGKPAYICVRDKGRKRSHPPGDPSHPRHRHQFARRHLRRPDRGQERRQVRAGELGKL